MSISEEITEYEINYLGGGQDAGGYPYRAIIKFRRKDGTLIGAAYFHRNASYDDGKCFGISQQDHVFRHFRESDYGHILDISRVEPNQCFVENMEV